MHGILEDLQNSLVDYCMNKRRLSIIIRWLGLISSSFQNNLATIL